ncbi:unnamed protein product, partial [Ectocarpus sp. 8 AP-2014]
MNKKNVKNTEVELVLSLQGNQFWLQVACTRTPQSAASAAAAKTRQEKGHQPNPLGYMGGGGKHAADEVHRRNVFALCTSKPVLFLRVERINIYDLWSSTEKHSL